MEKSQSCRRESTDSSSPEFEFWMIRNPSFPQPQLLTADELFDNGVLLPLHNLSQPKCDQPDPEPDPDPLLHPEPPPPAAAVGFSSSKRWKDIFKKVEKKPPTSSISSGTNEDDVEEKEKEQQDLKKKKKPLLKKDRKSSSTSAANAADLNINIWPFSRSRSAGTGGRGKPSSVAATRKVSSAPCSRSNSRGESSKSRNKWPSSPARPGLHLGRSSPVWQVRRGAGSAAKPCSEPPVSARNAADKDKGGAGAPKEGSGSRRSTNGNGGHARVLNLNVPLCIGYRHHLSCRSDDNTGSVSGPSLSHSSSNTSNHSNSSNNGNATLFNLRALFSKKVY